MALSKEYSLYNKGLCFIFNNIQFRQQPTRWGSDKDAQDIDKVLRGLNFDVHTLTNCTANAIRVQLLNLYHPYYRRYHCLFIFFLTHGYEKGIYSIDEECISFNEIQSHLTAAQCPAFKGKAKVFVFGSCRAEQDFDSTLRLMEEDFLLVFATQASTEANRDTRKGNFYIQCLLEAIREEADSSDILKILTRAAGILKSKLPYQRSQICSMLVKDLYLSKQPSSASSSLHDEKELTVKQEQSTCATQEGCTNKGVMERIKQSLTQREKSEAPQQNSSPLPVTNYDCGVCIAINNSGMDCLLKTEDLHAIYQQCGYAILTFTNISEMITKCLVGVATESYHFNSFMLFVLSQEESNITNTVIAMEDTIGCFSGTTNSPKATPKLLYFQTSSNSKKVVEDKTTVEKKPQLCSNILPDKSIYCHVSTESPLVPILIEMLQNPSNVNLYVTQLVKSIATEENVAKQPSWQKLVIKGEIKQEVSFEKFHVSLACLTLAVQVRLAIGQELEKCEKELSTIQRHYETFVNILDEHEDCRDVSEMEENVLVNCWNFEKQLLEKVKLALTSLRELILSLTNSERLLERVQGFQERYEQYTLEFIDRKMTEKPHCDPTKLIQAYINYIESLLADTHAMGRDIQQLIVREEEEETSHCEAARD